MSPALAETSCHPMARARAAGGNVSTITAVPRGR